MITPTDAAAKNRHNLVFPNMFQSHWWIEGSGVLYLSDSFLIFKLLIGSELWLNELYEYRTLILFHTASSARGEMGGWCKMKIAGKNENSRYVDSKPSGNYVY